MIVLRIAIGSDHVGFPLKTEIRQYLEQLSIDCVDFGTHSTDRTDYPLYAERVARAVTDGTCDRGILICGTGVGMSIAANKVPGIRAVVCSEPYSAKLSREHNNTNVLCLGARVIGSELAKMVVDAWLNAQYHGGRHQRRLDQIALLERREAIGPALTDCQENC
ncbi:MAG TPA: ribose 5-phosphate isomerase B [Porticoccaceae bacterium]